MRAVYYFIGIISFLVSSQAEDKDESFIDYEEFLKMENRVKLPSIDLDSLILKINKGVKRLDTLALKSQWIGRIKSVFVGGDSSGLYEKKKDEVLYLRFTHGWVREGKLIIARMKRTSYLSTEAAQYYDKLPTLEEIKKCTTENELAKRLGPQQGFRTGYVDNGKAHVTSSWVCFTRLKNDRLRYLNIFAHVSTSSDSEISEIDIINIEEGFFKKADLDSQKEKELYLSGEEVFLREEKEAADIRAKFPQPLRELLAVRELPGNSLTRYSAYLDGIRDKPDKKLFQQLLKHAQEGRVWHHSYLSDIFDEKFIVPLKDWEPGKLRESLLLLIESLGQTRDYNVLSESIIVILRAAGGGTVDVKEPEKQRWHRISAYGQTTIHAHARGVPKLAETQELLRRLVNERLPQ